MQLPNGIIATINSPSTDNLGRSGSEASAIDHYFVERFGVSLLFSILGAYTANAGVNGQDNFNSTSLYRMSLVQSLQSAARDSMQRNLNIPPTLKVLKEVVDIIVQIGRLSPATTFINYRADILITSL